MAYPYGYPPAYPGFPTDFPSPGYPAARSYYFIRSRLNGLVLDVEGENRNPGARVVMWNQKSGACDNQLWCDDYATGTIRSKLNDFCLDWDGSAITIRTYYPGSPNQQWERADPFIRNRATPNKVLDIANNNSAAGAHLVSWDRSGNLNQCFDIQFVGAAQPAPQPVPRKPAPRRYFYIVSDMHRKVLDVEGGSSNAGTRVIVWPKKGGSNQLWYFDENGIILSALNDYALSANSHGDQVVMLPFDNRPPQHWRSVGNRIMKNEHECLDICGADKKDGANVLSYGYKGSTNQHWHVEYA